MTERLIQSMTGSGMATGECELGRLTIEIRSVNGRGAISVRSRVASECAGLEPAIESMLRARFARGSFSVAIDRVDDARSAAAIDEAAFGEVVDRLRRLAERHGLPSPTLADVLVVQGVLPSNERERARTSSEPSARLLELLHFAVDRLTERRVIEGAATLQAMRSSLEQLDSELAAVRTRLPAVVDQHRTNLLARVREFLDERGAQIEARDVIREVALFADRVDVSEEMQRLAAHIARMRADLAGPGPIGRDLEFLLQEMLREVNTLGSKSPDVEVSHRVVAMKSMVDKLKEQAANLE